MFFGSSASQTTAKQNTNSRSTRTAAVNEALRLTPEQVRQEKQDLEPPQPIVYNPEVLAIPEAKRNIFAFYTPPPKPSPTALSAAALQPTATPPTLILASVSPINVFARTGDFTIEVTGDKFTPATRINIDGSELPTRFLSPQQLSANVPAALIAAEGGRQITVRSPDGKLFSNAATLNVSPPPAPNYTYIGIIGGPRYNDTAVVKDKSSNELLNVQRGDVIGGRFRITSISERELVLTDTSLRLKHTIPFTRDTASSTLSNRIGPTPIRPVPASDDSEP
jgi:hypothetical protein